MRVVDLAAISMPSGSSSSGSTSSGVGPATVSRAGTPTARSASKARRRTGSPFRSSARPTKTIRSSSCECAWFGLAAARSTPFGTIR